jgi:hypothetical protein
MEPNVPTPSQMSTLPDGSGNVSYYQKLGSDAPKTMDWKRKLGGMLIDTLGGKEQKGQLSDGCNDFH